MNWPSLDESVSLHVFVYCPCMQSCNTASLFIYFKLASRCKKKKKKTSGSGRVRALNLTVPLGLGWVGSGRVRRSRVRAGFGLLFKARADL